MDTEITSPARKFHRAAWFAIGALCGLTELLPKPLFCLFDRSVDKVQAADRTGAFGDGYDLVADFACRRAYSRAGR